MQSRFLDVGVKAGDRAVLPCTLVPAVFVGLSVILFPVCCTWFPMSDASSNKGKQSAVIAHSSTGQVPSQFGFTVLYCLRSVNLGNAYLTHLRVAIDTGYLERTRAHHRVMLRL